MAKRKSSQKAASPGGYHQQGDVLLFPVRQLPTQARRVATRANGRIVLAEGEVTGHAHVVVAEPEVSVELFELDGVTYLRTSGPSSLVHEEHHQQLLAPGTYRVGGVREYDHFAEEARRVAD